jgi:catechol 2,3-dioxygenase-like lactoylglutathione lyase family enzyme
MNSMTLELVVVPVSDVDRAKAFYVEQAGFVADHDRTFPNGLRFVQLTPPGSACSIAIGTGLVTMEPGVVKGLQLVVEDLDATRAELRGRGLEIGEIEQIGPVGTPGARIAFFRDPDGNGWAVQEILPHHRHQEHS